MLKDEIKKKSIKKKTLRGWDSGHPGKIKKIFEVLISHIKK
jgi:hypothetical protein